MRALQEEYDISPDRSYRNLRRLRDEMSRISRAMRDAAFQDALIYGEARLHVGNEIPEVGFREITFNREEPKVKVTPKKKYKRNLPDWF